MYRQVLVGLIYFFLAFPAAAESFRVLVTGELELSSENPEGFSANLAYNNAVVIRMGRGSRFFRGVELELSAPQSWLLHQGSLSMLMYGELDRAPVSGINDLEGRRIAFEPLPNKIKMIYQIPVRASHGLRSSPYATVIAGITPPASFPIIFRLLPIIKGISEDLEKIQFVLNVRPILGEEGAVRLIPRYPDQHREMPFTLQIDGATVQNTAEEQILKEGEHHLVVHSEHYRTESRRFIVERAKRQDLIIMLQDLTPLIIFEAPENALIFMDNAQVSRETNSIAVEPGIHEVKVQVGDYTLTKTITAQRGKTYRVALTVGIDIEENE